MTGRLNAHLRLARGGFHLDAKLDCALDRPIGLFGPSGSGKTSLLRAICGLEPATRGHLQLGERVLQDDRRGVPTWQRRIAMVFQDPLLFDHLDVAGNLALGRRVASADGLSRDAVADLMEIHDLLDRPVTALSGGERRRVAIAQALMSQPDLLLLDEPLSGLDQGSARRLADRLRNCLGALRLAVIVVSHAMPEMLRLSEHLILLDRGRVTRAGPTRRLATDLELGLAHDDQAMSLLRGSVLDHEPDYELSRVNCDGATLYLPQVDLAGGAVIEVLIAARDVSLTRHSPGATSILNVVPAKVVATSESGNAFTTVQLNVGGQTLLSRITRKSADALRLRPGDTIWAQIKTAVLAGQPA